MDKIKEIIKKKLKDHKYEGLVSVYKGSESLYVGSEGYKKNSVFTFEKTDEFFITVLLLILLEKNKIDLNAKLDKYIPELKDSSKISFLNLLRFSTGLLDYLGYLSSLRLKDDAYMNLSDEEKLNFDFNCYINPINYDDALKFYNENELYHAPGSEVDFGDATKVLGHKLVEVLNKKTYEESLNELIFKPLKIKFETKNLNAKRSLNIYYNRKIALKYNDLTNFIGLKALDVHKIYMGLKTGVLVSKKTFKEMTKIIDFNGINFTSGYSYAYSMSIYRYNVIDFKNEDLQIVFLNDFSGFTKYQNEEFLQAEVEIVKNIAPIYHKVSSPKLVKLNKNNVYDLFEIKNSEDKSWFMGPTKYMLAYQYTEKNAVLYLVKDSNITVGTITLYIDKKGNNYSISNILIDEKYQQMGYGRKTIILSYEIFKKAGAKTVTLFLDKNNKLAYKTYLKAGFKVRSAYLRSYEMYIDL